MKSIWYVKRPVNEPSNNSSNSMAIIIVLVTIALICNGSGNLFW